MVTWERLLILTFSRSVGSIRLEGKSGWEAGGTRWISMSCPLKVKIGQGGLHPAHDDLPSLGYPAGMAPEIPVVAAE